MITFQYKPPSRLCTKSISVRACSFQIEVIFMVLQILVHCCYDAFLGSKLCSTKVGFQFWEQTEVIRGHIRRIWGMRKDFESALSRSSHGNFRLVSRRIVLQEQNTSSQFSSPLSCYFLGQAPQFCCIICTIYRMTLLKIISHDYSLTFPKN